MICFMKTINEINIERLNELVHKYGSQSKLAQLIDKTPTQISQWISGYRNPSSSTLRMIEKKLNLPQAWLDQPTQTNQGGKIESNATLIGGVEVWDDDTPLRDDEVEVPFYKEVCLAAGNGFIDNGEYWEGQKLRFSKTTFKRKGIYSKDVACVSVDGNSMEPVIPDGATIGINMAEKTIKDGKIYAINHDGLLRTKILYKLPSNRIRIRSYNSEEHPDEEVNADEISVIGKVFWWSVMI